MEPIDDGVPTDVITSIQVHESTRRLLESRKRGGESYDDVILDLIDQEPTEAEIREFDRRMREGGPSIPLEETRKRLGL
jgi:predicted CopG family antitoxin